MPCLPHERLVWQHYDLPFVKPTTLQQQIGPSPRMPLLDFSSRLKLRASYSNTQISLLSLSRCSSRHCNLLTKRGIAPWTLTLTLIFDSRFLAFSVDFLSGISSYVDSSVFLWIRDQIAPLCAGFRAFFEENLHQFLGVLVTAKSSGFGLIISFIFVVFFVFCRIGLRFSSPCSLALAKSDPVFCSKQRNVEFGLKAKSKGSGGAGQCKWVVWNFGTNCEFISQVGNGRKRIQHRFRNFKSHMDRFLCFWNLC